MAVRVEEPMLTMCGRKQKAELSRVLGRDLFNSSVVFLEKSIHNRLLYPRRSQEPCI